MDVLCFILALLVFFIGVPASIIWLIVALCTKKDKKNPLTMLAGCFAGAIVLMIASFNITSEEGSETADSKDAVIESAEDNEEAVEEDAELISITPEEYKSSCSEYNYKDVLRNPKNYIGEKIKVTVEISSVHEESFLIPTKYYFAYSESDYGYYGDRYAIFDTRESDDLKLLEDDIIIVYGEIAETEHTESAIVNSEEVFAINMKYVELIGE